MKDQFPKIKLDYNWTLLLAAYPKLVQYSDPLWIELSKKLSTHGLSGDGFLGYYLSFRWSYSYQENSNYRIEPLGTAESLEKLKTAIQGAPKSLGILGFFPKDFL